VVSTRIDVIYSPKPKGVFFAQSTLKQEASHRALRTLREERPQRGEPTAAKMFNSNPEIGMWGGMALLVSSITGPALTTSKPRAFERHSANCSLVPLIFQESGWLLFFHTCLRMLIAQTGHGHSHRRHSGGIGVTPSRRGNGPYQGQRAVPGTSRVYHHCRIVSRSAVTLHIADYFVSCIAECQHFEHHHIMSGN